MKNVILVILVLFSIHFWGWVRIPSYYYSYFDLLSLTIMGYSFISMINDKTLLFRNAIIFFLIGIVLNILSAQFNNGQTIRDTAFSCGHFYFILFYFWLHQNKIERKDLENLIIVFAIIYAVFYLIQIQEFPRRLFRGTLFADRGTVRLRMQGASFHTLAFFLLLNRYLLKRKVLDIVLAVFLLYITIKGGTRTFTAASVLLSGFIFLRLVKYNPINYFLIIVAMALFLGLMQTGSTATIIDNMINTTQQQQEEGDEYIRVVQRKYFTSVYPKNWTYYVVGGGFPGGKGGYSRYMNEIVAQYGFYWSDQGLLGFLLVMGGITTLGLLFWVFKGMFLKLPIDRLYLNIYFVYLLLASNIVMDEIFARGIFGIQAIALYLIDLSRREMKEKELEVINKDL